MALSETILRDKVWKRTGLSPSELAEETINEAIGAALTEYNNYRVNTKCGPLTVVAGETDIPFPAGVTSISDVLYPGDSILSTIGTFSMEDALLMGVQQSSIGDYFGGNVFENPSLSEIFFTKLRALRDTFGMTDWRILDGENPKIRLGIIPTEDGAAYYEGSGPWTIDKVASDDEEMFFKSVMWKICEGWAMRLAVVNQMSDGTGATVSPAFKFWDDKAAYYEKAFLLDAGATRGSMIIG